MDSFITWKGSVDETVLVMLVRDATHTNAVSANHVLSSLPQPCRFLLRACLHDVSVESSNEVLLKLPIVHSAGSGQRYFNPATTADSVTISNGKHENEVQVETSGGVIEKGDRDKQEGEGEVEAESNVGERGEEGLHSSTSKGLQEDVSKTDIGEDRTIWKGESLKPLRTPLFMLEIAPQGEKGKEVFAYAQQLGAVKESVLMLIDKAVGSTQVMAAAAGLCRHLECPRWYDSSGICMNASRFAS